MQRTIILLCFLAGATGLCAQDFMLQGWYWDYDKDGCNGYTGPNWAARLNGQVSELAAAGITYAWLPPASRSSFGECSNGYDPKDLYDLGEYSLGRTGFGTAAEVSALNGNLRAAGIEPVADVVYNHRDGGTAEDNPAVKAYVETHFNGNGQAPFPSDRYRLRLPLGGDYGAGDYYVKISSKTGAYDDSYKFYATVEGVPKSYRGSTSESEPNGGGDCGQAFDDVALDQDMLATLADFGNCRTDEFKLSLTSADFQAGGDNLLIFLNNTSGGYSDHRIYDIYYASTDGRPSRSVNLADLRFQTYTDFTNLPSNQGGMTFENFRPNTANAATTFLNGDFDSPLFFYDVVQAETSTATVYTDWSEWLLTSAGFGGLRMDAVKHFPPGFVATVLDNLAGRGLNPGMVVGEFFDGNATLLKDWVEDVEAAVQTSTSDVRVFDFSLRNALKAACDQFGYDARDVFEASLYDNGLSGFNVVTFVNNHDFRGPGEAVQNDAVLAYAYILTNNQLGVPTVFYPDFFGTQIPDAPVNNLSAEISQLIEIHKDHIFGSPNLIYLNEDGTPYPAAYQSGAAENALIYQMNGGASGEEIVVAINFSGSTLKVDQTLNLPANAGRTFTDLTGRAFNPTATTDGENRLLIDVPARSYAVYVSGAVLPVTLADFTAAVDGKGLVTLDWSTTHEETLRAFVPEVSADGRTYRALATVTPQNAPAAYRTTDDRAWAAPRRYYRLRTVSADGTEELGPVRRLAYASQRLRLSPNPTSGYLRVTGLQEGAAWELIAADGRRVSVAASGTGDGLRLDLRGLAGGVYWLRGGGEVRRVMVR